MSNKKISITDVTLRDGMHAISHQFEVSEMMAIATKLDQGGVDIIEVTHGDGLNGNSVNYGFSKFSDEEYIRGVASVVKNAKIAALLLPGIGTIHDIKNAISWGIGCVRVATHCTEADISQQHIEFAKSQGLNTVGFLMMSHMIPPSELVKQAKLMESYGADCVYVVDSSGALLMHEVSDRVKAFKDTLQCEVGYHAHHNLSLGVANSIIAIEQGADRIDASLVGMGAGAGNAPLEILAAVTERMGINIGCNLYDLMDAADDIVRPVLEKNKRHVRVDRESLSLGFAGVYSSFLWHSRRASERFGVDTHDILVELGRRKMVGGQEDMIVDVALNLAKNVIM